MYNLGLHLCPETSESLIRPFHLECFLKPPIIIGNFRALIAVATFRSKLQTSRISSWQGLEPIHAPEALGIKVCDLGNSEQSIRYHRWGLQVFPVFRTSANPTPATWLGGDENPLHGTLTTCQKEHLWHSDVSFYNTWRWCQFILFWGLTLYLPDGSENIKFSAVALRMSSYRWHWIRVKTVTEWKMGVKGPQICRNEVMKLSYPRTYEWPGPAQGFRANWLAKSDQGAYDTSNTKETLTVRTAPVSSPLRRWGCGNMWLTPLTTDSMAH